MGAASTSQTVEFIRGCLQQGFTQEEIAQSLAVDPSYVSQLCSAHKLSAGNERFAEIDDLYEQLERQALQQLKRVMGTVHDPLKLTRIAASMNSSKRRSLASPIVTEGRGTLVQLTLPQAMAAQFIFNASGEAVACQSEGATRPLVTVTAEQLAGMAAAQAAAHNARGAQPLEAHYEHLPNLQQPGASASCADSDM